MNPQITELLSENQEMTKVLEECLDWLNNAPISYENGNTDPTGSIDEGDVLGWRYHERLRSRVLRVLNKEDK